MVRDVKYIWYGINYRQLKNTLKENKKIRSLPLVDSPGTTFCLSLTSTLCDCQCFWFICGVDYPYKTFIVIGDMSDKYVMDTETVLIFL